MSADEMRTELEAFVNAGLRQGWRGWPRKAQVAWDRGLGGWSGAAPAGVDDLTTLVEERFGRRSDVFATRYSLLY